MTNTLVASASAAIDVGATTDALLQWAGDRPVAAFTM
jgi:hypothetical protein